MLRGGGAHRAAAPRLYAALKRSNRRLADARWICCHTHALALDIRTDWRKRQWRKFFQGVLTLQRLVRMWLAYRHFRRIASMRLVAVRAIQHATRRRIDAAKQARLRAVLRLQAVVRTALAVRALLRARRAAVRIQRQLRSHRPETREEEKAQEKGTLGLAADAMAGWVSSLFSPRCADAPAVCRLLRLCPHVLSSTRPPAPRCPQGGGSGGRGGPARAVSLGAGKAAHG